MKKTEIETKKFRGRKAIFALIAVIALGFSVYLSLSSFTGYIISEEISAGKNTFALVLFLAGIGAAYMGLRK